MLSRLLGRPKAPPYLALAEYWVYLDEPKAPKQDDVMGRMIQDNPYTKGAPPIGTREGLLWSDIRFHMALALRGKNAHIFRPDLFESHVDPSAEDLAALGNAQAVMKLRYVSEQPLPDCRHLQFLAYAVEAVASLAKARVIFDLVGERLFSFEFLREALQSDPNGARRELHMRTVWRSCENGGTAETRGLNKIGFPELCTPPTMPDHRVVACQVLELAAEKIWDTGCADPKIVLEHFGDTFHVEITPTKKGPSKARILRENH